MRHNYMRMVQVDGTEIVNHDGKTSPLTNYSIRSIIRQPGYSANADISRLYEERPQPSNSLTDTFSEAETKRALLPMNRNSAPGPDGFDPVFYRSSGLDKSQSADHGFHGGFPITSG